MRMTNKKVDETVKAVIVEELHKPARKRYPRRRVALKGINDLWQADLVEMIPYARFNGGHKYLLTVIDCFTKYAWAVAVKSKSAGDVTRAMNGIFKIHKSPKNLQTDQGREFYNVEFQRLMDKFGVNHYSTQSNLKASIVERFNRTLKAEMWKQFSLRGSYRWTDIIKSLLDRYNNKVHRSTGLKPVLVTEADVNRIMKRLYPPPPLSPSVAIRPARYAEGDYVRISKQKTVFDKGYTPNWSAEIFRVARVRLTNPSTYLLEDYQGRPVKGGFYAQELQRVSYPDVYLVEKVLRRRGGKSYVKWIGFSSEHNSWI